MDRRRRGSEFHDAGPWAVRRWQSAKNNSCNPGRWQDAHGQSINTDLNTDLRVLMARCANEFANNPNFEGVVNQFKRDVVGPDGPMLQVVSDDQAFNDDIERQWKGIFAHPNPGRPSTGGVESMKQWVHLLLTAGSYLNIFIEPKRDGLAAFGWRTLHPRRLVTPLAEAGNTNVAFGIKLNADGDPIEYYIDKPRPVGLFQLSGIEFDRLPAHQVQHRYIEVEPEQITGFPMMASTLDTAADIRELDLMEIKAQQRNAAYSIGLQSQSPESVVDPDPIDTDSISVSDDTVNVAPLGWAWQNLDANRPSPDHINYRRERLAELGRPIGMPLLFVMLTAADSNFSSAQFEGMVYAEAIRDIQSFIARLTLNELVEMVILERVLSGQVQRPGSYELVWTHHVPTHANIEKFAKALRTMIEDGVISRSIATAWVGFDPEKVESSRARENERADERGIARPPVNTGSGRGDAQVLRDVANNIDNTSQADQPGGTKNAAVA